MKNFLCLLTVFVWGIVISTVCFADTIYVDQSGGGDYTTIQAGIKAAYASDTIEVGPGIYNENVTIDKNLTLIASGPNLTSIDASQDAITVNENISANISKFTITAGDNGVNLSKNCSVNIKNCIIASCATGISCYGKTDLNVTVINNTIVSNANSGIFVKAYSTYYSSAGSVNIQGNIIAFNGEYGIYLIAIDNENIAYNNVYGNSNGGYSGCSAGANDFSDDPRFIDNNAGNYALRIDSPCIDAGRPVNAYNDPDGTRNDMGAYAGPDSASFWPYVSGGPVVTEISLTPASAPKGSKIIIKAKGRVQ